MGGDPRTPLHFLDFWVGVVCDNNGHGTPEPEEAVAHLLPFYLAPWAMFPEFSLPCRLCPLLRCFLEQLRGSYIFFHPPTDGRAFAAPPVALTVPITSGGKTRMWELRTQCVVKQLLPSIDIYFRAELKGHAHLPAAVKCALQLSDCTRAGSAPSCEG